ncbi:hypothetical protein EYC80_001375 [Monilinia laxa]|uniref:Uncharacterized protein n=1 Tax=Monilinia laxa TaxID=61186 RepID=A0A5N6K929_MONLA|nr:hypothetical protein EYC80_001375 [Monilinia laxa]
MSSRKVSTQSKTTLNIGPVHHPPSFYSKSSDLESPNKYEPGFPVKSPLMPPIESAPDSASSTMVNDSSAKTEDNVMKERNEAIRRTSDLREQLEMEKVRSATLKEERDDAIIRALAMEVKVWGLEKEELGAARQCWQTRHQLRELAIKLGEVSAGDKLALVQTERNQAITREMESLAQKNKAEEARDKALELLLELGSQIKQLLKELSDAHKLASRTLSQKKKVERERDEACECTFERLEDLIKMVEMHEKEKERKEKSWGFLGAVGTIFNLPNWE